MQTFLKLLSYAGLALSFVSALLIFAGKIPLQTHHHLMLAGMFVWFVPAILTIKPDKTEG